MIFINQVGYPTNSKKVAVSLAPCNFQVIDIKDNHIAFEGKSSDIIYDPSAEENVYQLDFSELTTPGEYYIMGGNTGKSYAFVIGDVPYSKLIYDVSKCLYYQRCGCGLEERFAGIYKRPSCHTAESILLEDYIRKTPNPKTYDTSGGWHDAGDFGKYVSAGAVAVAHILYAYELYPEAFGYSMNIPESGNGIPDILNECYYELSWMLKMQSSQGGVYHKVTAFKHPEFIMPQDDKDDFLIFPVSSFSTADFAAVMALASRVYKPFMPEFSERAFEAAVKAGEWLGRNSYVGFKNPEGCNTGEYGDETDTDERLWAFAELARVDKAKRTWALKKMSLLLEEDFKYDFGWEDVSGLAAFSVLTDPEHTFGTIERKFENEILKLASRNVKSSRQNGYMLAMNPDEFVWGSNMQILNKSILMILASRLSKGSEKDSYINCALEHIHYILGRNPLNISYVTGFGENAFKNPHHRVTETDGVDTPHPGWVSGGPFGHFCDDAAKNFLKPGTAPMKCYVDHVGSYSTNEVTIYWNSPLIFILAFINSQIK